MRLTNAERNIVDTATQLLDYISRVVGAVKDGNGDYLHAKLCQLDSVVGRFTRATETRQRFDGPRVAAQISHEARGYEAGRSLFPLGNNPAEATRRRALEQAANDIQFDPPGGLDPQAVVALARWLRERANKPV